jgi:L-lactate dehydrogenase complex protein LldF
VKIPLPDLLRKLRERQFDRHLRPLSERWALWAWGFSALRPNLYRLIMGIANRVLRVLAGRSGRISSLPWASGWTQYRDMAAPTGKTFSERYADWQARKAFTRSSTSVGPL